MVKVPNGRGSGASEEAILGATRDLLAEKGLQGLSMRAQEKNVGVSAPSL